MAEDKIKQIMINGHLVGIVGLDDAIKKINLRTTVTKKLKISAQRNFCQ